MLRGIVKVCVSEVGNVDSLRKNIWQVIKTKVLEVLLVILVIDLQSWS